MKVYILGICGTFMAGVAVLARELGYQVSGSDAQVYPTNEHATGSCRY